MTDKLKICVYAISKNEVKFVERFYNSCKEADLILLVDTGSTDATVARAKSLGIKTYEVSVQPWRFDTARNASIALIPSDIDVCVCIDLDEVLMPGWRQEIERLWVKGETTRMRYMYDWGNNLVFHYEKIHSKSGYWWKNACHEVLVNDPRVDDVWVETNMLLVKHLPDMTKSRGQYLDLLKTDVLEDANNVRNTFYYARELSFNHRHQEAIDWCEKFLDMPEANWDHERAYAYRVMGKSYDMLGNHAKALESFRKACIEAPSIREPWIDLAFSCYCQNEWKESFFAASNACDITQRQYFYTCDPESWGARPYDLASIAAYHLGLKKWAVEYASKAVELDPNDERLKYNLSQFQLMP